MEKKERKEEREGRYYLAYYELMNSGEYLVQEHFQNCCDVWFGGLLLNNV